MHDLIYCIVVNYIMIFFKTKCFLIALCFVYFLETIGPNSIHKSLKVQYIVFRNIWAK